jgi:hypothetical protein
MSDNSIKLTEINWLPPILLSIDVLVLLIAITLITKMSYNRQVQSNRLNYYPYYVTLVYLTIEFLELILIIRETNQFTGWENYALNW